MRVLFVAFLMAGFLFAPAYAQNAPVNDPSFLVVQEQLEAVRNRDAALAFSLIAPSFQKKFADAKAYLRDIRFKDHPLYSHIAVRLLGSTRSENSIIHRVEVQDVNGKKSIILFRVVLDSHGKWQVMSAATLNETERSL